MPQPLSLTPELAATIRGARLVGTPLRDCVKAAGVPWQTAMEWLRKGRAYNAATPSERNPRHTALGAFAADLDRAGAQATAALHARVMAETARDGGLALKVLQWNEERPMRALKRELVRAQVEVERLRAAGDLSTDATLTLTVTDARSQLAAQLARAAAGAAAGAAGGTSGEPVDGSGGGSPS